MNKSETLLMVSALVAADLVDEAINELPLPLQARSDVTYVRGLRGNGKQLKRILKNKRRKNKGK